MEKEKNGGVVKESALEMIASLLGIEKKEGMIVYQYNKPTDDCLCPGHVAITAEPNGKNFFGVPQKVVTWNK